MNINLIKDIAKNKAAIEAYRLMLEEYCNMTSPRIGEIRYSSKGSHSDGGMAAAMDRKDRTFMKLQAAYQRYRDAVNKGIDEIELIEDARMKAIIILRYSQELRWEQVAKTIGGQATADSVKKSTERFLAQHAHDEDRKAS